MKEGTSGYVVQNCNGNNRVSGSIVHSFTNIGTERTPDIVELLCGPFVRVAVSRREEVCVCGTVVVQID
jgi:hypothetical protein